VQNIWLTLDKAIPCGLLVNELVVNALKHAFPDGRAGKIEVSMARTENNSIMLSVNDDGIGNIGTWLEEDEPHTIGLSLVKNLASQLGGILEIRNEKGIKVGFIFPS
jgi:two-component sensor histidine kinase